jgi:DNA-directed RNA polymerase specialized sigma24 family protein
MLRRDPLGNLEPLIKRVYAYVAYRVGDGHDAEDLTSETFERALRYRKSYDPRKGEPIAWLLGIAKRCIDGRGPTMEFASDYADEATESDVEEETIRRLTVSSYWVRGRTRSRSRSIEPSAACAKTSVKTTRRV